MMRLSCNGCRVLRKGCSDACTIRPCLQWINSPDAQANATVFLAKFYGRAGLLNLIAAAPTDALRPAVFRSLLYEACGRIVNPVYGAVGLLWSGNWHMCQAAVEAVLKGAPIVQVAPDDAAAAAGPPPIITAAPMAAAAAAAAYDIRHVKSSSSSNNKHPPPPAAAAPQKEARPVADDKDTDRRLKVSSKPKFKRKNNTKTNNKHPHPAATASPDTEHDDMLVVTDRHHSDQEEQQQQQQQHAAVGQGNRRKSQNHPSSDDDDCDRHSDSASASLDTEEAASHVSQAHHQQDDQQAEQQPPSMGLLDLTLGLVTSSAPTPAGCTQRQRGASSAAVDDPAGVIAFRFL